MLSTLVAHECCPSCDSSEPSVYHESNCDIGHELLGWGAAFQCSDCGDIRPPADRVPRRRDGRFAVLCVNCYAW